MMLNKMIGNNAILETAMQGQQVRKDVILNNIANVDTPKFKKSAVYFEEALKTSIRRSNARGVGQPVDLSGVKPTVRQINTALKYRLDGNNVDIEAEMLDLYETSVRYDVKATSIMNNFKRINTVLSAR